MDTKKQKEIDIIPGQIFGQLTVVERDVGRKTKAHHWFCRCTCGITPSIRASYLRSGKATSCGHARGGKRENSGGYFPIRQKPSPKQLELRAVKNGIKVNGVFVPRADLLRVLKEMFALAPKEDAGQ